jgi:shikimate dehydrogenase
MHEASFASLGLEATYQAFDVPPDQLGQQLAFCRQNDFKGLNITIPHKTAIMPLLTRIDARAAHLGAVNTVHFETAGVMTGYNTDIIGFLADLKESCGITPADRRVLVLGCGGAGRAITFACATATEIYLADLLSERAQVLAQDLQTKKQGDSTSRTAAIHILPPQQERWVDVARSCDLIIQCTPAGLKPEDPSVLPAHAFHAGQTVYDIVTSPHPPTLATALAAGAQGVNGVGMLIRQGAASFKIWTGLDADLDAMRNAIVT